MSPADYTWFDEALRAMKMPKFFSCSSDTNRDAIHTFEREHGALPAEYREFLLQYGEVKLFRNLATTYYKLHLYSVPRIYEAAGLTFAELGSVDTRFIYLEKDYTDARFTPGVLEHQTGAGIREVAATFSAWLPYRFGKLRKQYSKRDWEFIERGPAPFSPSDLDAVRLRAGYSVRKVGCDDRRNVLLEITNGSNGRLQYLTVLLHATDRGFRMPVPVPVAEVAPGETKTVPIAYYKKWADPATVVLVPLDPPEPADRLMFFELAGPDWYRRRLSEGRKMPSENVD